MQSFFEIGIEIDSDPDFDPDFDFDLFARHEAIQNG